MATVDYYINPDQPKHDGTWRVKIRLTHKTVNKYIPTNVYVVKDQLNKDVKIKDHFINDILRNYRKKITDLGDYLDIYTADELKTYLMKKEIQRIDFIEWSRSLISEIKVKGTKANAFTTLNSFIDFVGTSIDINHISLITIKNYEAFLRTKRKAKRVTNTGKPPITLTLKPVTDTGVKDYITKLQNWYKEAMKHYNHRNEVLIPFNPFEQYDMPSYAETEDRDLPMEIIRAIRDCPDLKVGKYGRAKVAALARDCFMLSFYLVAMNAVDLYNVDEYKDGRISYNRSKTASRRADNAFISIKVEPEAIALIEKYRDPSGERVFVFYKWYSDHDGFTAALNRGLKTISDYLRKNEELCAQFEIPDITYYCARYSWPNIARNDCDVPKDDVTESMNHTDGKHKTTDIYLRKTWGKIDSANRKVLDYLYETKKVIQLRVVNN